MSTRSEALTELISAETVGRFLQDLRATGWADRPTAVAVSGGPDSTALLLLAAAVPIGKLSAVTVNHGLREGSAQEAEQVGQLCERIGVPHSILNAVVRKGHGGPQAAARPGR